MKKLIAIITTSIVLSASAFASTSTYSRNTVIETDGYTTRAEAYNAGFDVADELETASDSQLRFKLPVTNAKDVSIDDVEVSIEEFAVERGVVNYRAIVDVDYTYTANDS